MLFHTGKRFTKATSKPLHMHQTILIVTLYLHLLPFALLTFSGISVTSNRGIDYLKHTLLSDKHLELPYCQLERLHHHKCVITIQRTVVDPAIMMLPLGLKSQPVTMTCPE